MSELDLSVSYPRQDSLKLRPDPLEALQGVIHTGGSRRSELELVEVPLLGGRHMRHQALDLLISRYCGQEIEQTSPVGVEPLDTFPNVPCGEWPPVVIEAGVDQEVWIVVGLNRPHSFDNAHGDRSLVTGFHSVGVRQARQGIRLGSPGAVTSREIEDPSNPVVRLDVLDANAELNMVVSRH